MKLSPEQPITTITANAVCKWYGTKFALKRVSFNAHTSEIVTISGQNGAGKSTLLNLLANTIKPDEGTILLNQHTPHQWRQAYYQQIGIVSHKALLYGSLTVHENLLFYARLFQIPNFNATINSLIDRLEISEFSSTPVRELSHGNVKRVSIARALLHQPRVLIMDEPESGLSPRAIDILAELIREFAQTGIVICATHTVNFSERVATRHVTLSDGRVVTG